MNLAIAFATLIVCCVLLRDVIIIGSTDNYDYKILQSDYVRVIYMLPVYQMEIPSRIHNSRNT